MFTVFLSTVLVLTTVLWQISPADADAVIGISNPSTDSSGKTTWDCIYFGNYWQNDTDNNQKADERDEKEAIKWRVLSVKDNEAILMAEQCLDCLPYNDEGGDDLEIFPAKWETSSLREWLNGTFYQSAFSAAEQNIIKTTTVVNEDNPLTGADGGKDTQDKVYLLSIAEAGKEEYGFESGFDIDSEARTAKATDYANGKVYKESDNASGWWLRSQGHTQEYVPEIDRQGAIDVDYGRFNDILEGVRPVIHIDLSVSSMWKNAGTVTAVKKPATTKKPTPTKPAPAPKLTEPPRKPAPSTTMKPGTKKAISSFKDLQAMEKIPSGNYYLTKDITVPKNTQLFCDYPFTGTLDGKGHKIKGYQFQKKYVLGKNIRKGKTLKEELIDGGGNDIIIEKPDAGIFSMAKKATFKNISVTNVNINVQTEGYAQVGALVAYTEDCAFTNVHSSGKISVRSTRESPLQYRETTVGGLLGHIYLKASKCYNKGAVSFSGRAKEDDSNSREADDVTNVAGLFGLYNETITQCYNKGKVSANVTNKILGGIRVGGIAGSADSYYGEVKNNYNAGTLYLKSKGGWVGGIAAYYDGGFAKSAQAKYNYNAGKIKTKSGKNIAKAAIFAANSDTEKVVRKRLAYHNYYKKQGSLKPYCIHVTWKGWVPKAKKVSKITKASCPKLSSKYWTYSGKVKRLVLKKNNEAKKAKKKK